MKSIKSYPLRLIINNLLLFVFLTFSLSDLIDMHLRIIFNVNITSQYDALGKKNNSYVKAIKKYKKIGSSGSNLNYIKPNVQRLTYFVNATEFTHCDFNNFITIRLLKNISGRAPPLS